MPDLLLSSDDVRELYFRIAHRPISRSPKQRKAFTEWARDRPEGRVGGTGYWIWSPAIYKQSERCLPEIRAGLSSVQAERWAMRSRRYDRQLKVQRLQLHRGILITHRWLKLAREYLLAMGREQLVPFPVGEFLTPTHPTAVRATSPRALMKDGSLPRAAGKPMVIRSSEELELTYRGQLEILRRAIENSARRKGTKPDMLAMGSSQRKPVAIGRKLKRDLLRYLEWRGEYKGFGRERSARYPVPWAWMKQPYTGEHG